MKASSARAIARGAIANKDRYAEVAIFQVAIMQDALQEIRALLQKAETLEAVRAYMKAEQTLEKVEELDAILERTQDGFRL